MTAATWRARGLVWLLLIGASIAVSLAASTVSAAGASDRSPIAVDAIEIANLDGAMVDEAYVGLVTPRRESQLGFENGGRLAVVSVDVGDRVEAGAELARLDLRTLEADISAAEAQVREAESGLRLARATEARQTELVAEGHVSRQRLDETDANVDASAARLGAAQARLDALTVRRDLAILTAPFAGVITERYLDEGAIAAAGAPVVDLVQTDEVEIRLGLPLERAEQLTPGDWYSFAIRGREVRARLRRNAGVVESTTQTVDVVFDVSEPVPAPGQVARLAMKNQLEQRGFWAPLAALSEGRRGLWTVFALEDDPDVDEAHIYRLSPRVVDILHVEAQRAFVRGGVQDGEVIVASGVDRVVADQRVTISDTQSRDEPDRLAQHSSE